MKAFISLSPKRGTFNTVLDELIKMGLSKKDVFLLFGPVDILVQIREIKNLNEFINKWFNPIVEIKSQEPMIEKTQTHIVISEGNAYDEEPLLSCSLMLRQEISNWFKKSSKAFLMSCQLTLFLDLMM
jgi:hypothetical protein